MPIRVKIKKQPGLREPSPDARGNGSTPLPRIGEGDKFREMIMKLSKSVARPHSRQLHPPVVACRAPC